MLQATERRRALPGTWPGMPPRARKSQPPSPKHIGKQHHNSKAHHSHPPSIHNLPATTALQNSTDPQHTKKEVPTECYFNRDFRKAAAAYSPTWWGSTIGASELNFSVRYGKRWILTAITAAVCYLREISFGLKPWLTQKISGY